jgi:hypothetical protein
MCNANLDYRRPKSVFGNSHMQSTVRIVKYLANTYFNVMLYSEAARSRFRPRQEASLRGKDFI